MITFTEQEKAVIMLGTASITEADGYGQEPTPEEMKFVQFVQRTYSGAYPFTFRQLIRV